MYERCFLLSVSHWIVPRVGAKNFRQITQLQRLSFVELFSNLILGSITNETNSFGS